MIRILSWHCLVKGYCSDPNVVICSWTFILFTSLEASKRWLALKFESNFCHFFSRIRQYVNARIFHFTWSMVRETPSVSIRTWTYTPKIQKTTTNTARLSAVKTQEIPVFDSWGPAGLSYGRIERPWAHISDPISQYHTIGLLTDDAIWCFVSLGERMLHIIHKSSLDKFRPSRLIYLPNLIKPEGEKRNIEFVCFQDCSPPS